MMMPKLGFNIKSWLALPCLLWRLLLGLFRTTMQKFIKDRLYDEMRSLAQTKVWFCPGEVSGRVEEQVEIRTDIQVESQVGHVLGQVQDQLLWSEPLDRNVQAEQNAMFDRIYLVMGNKAWSRVWGHVFQAANQAKGKMNIDQVNHVRSQIRRASREGRAYGNRWVPQ